MNRDDFYFFWKHEFGQWTRRDITDEFGRTYNCCEQYMMFQKSLLFGDYDIADKIMLEKRPSVQQDLGRKVKNFNTEVWDRSKEEIVYMGNLLKFDQHPDLKNRLIRTGYRVLVEASPFDKIWGVGLAESDDAILDPENWQGENLLGEVLMRVRNTYKINLKNIFNPYL